MRSKICSTEAGRAAALAVLLAVGLPGAEPRGFTGWRGPHCDGTGPACGESLAEDPAAIRRVWVSEARIPGTYEGDARKPSSPVDHRIPGGYASPIVADGRVYLFFYRPNGPVWAEEFATPHAAEGGFGREAYYTDADEVVLCVDAATGETLWERVIVEAGYNQEAGFNKGGCQLTPCIADGRVFAVGTSARVHAVDAESGELLWSADTGIRARYVDRRKAGWRERRTLAGGRNDFAGCVMTAGDVVAVSDHQEFKGGSRTMGWSNGLVGFDVETGALRWYVPDAGGEGMLAGTPLRWVHDGREYLLGSGIGGIKCIDPADGSILWTLEGVGFNNAGAVHGDLLICSADKQLACFELAPDGPTQRWRSSPTTGFTAPVVMDGHLYARAKRVGVRCIDLATGEVQGTAPAEDISGSMVGADARIVMHASGRAKRGLNLYIADPEDFRIAGDRLDVPFANSTTPAIADGRIYLRGRDRLYCYDLRSKP